MAEYRLTTKSQEAILDARHRASTAGHPYVEPIHLLLALLAQADGTARPLLEAVGASPDLLQQQAQAALERLPRASGPTVAQPGESRPVVAAINAAADAAKNRGDEYISTEHLLVGLATDGGTGLSGVTELLRGAGADPDALLAAFEKVRGSTRPVTTAEPESTYQALEKFGVDLTSRAREGRLDPVIGRDTEIRRVVQVLSRRTKNNPVLIGEPGVAKLPLSRASPSASSPATCRSRCATSGSSPSTSRRWWPARSTAVSSRSGSRPSSRRSATAMVESSRSSTRCTPSSARVRQKAPWTRATC